MAPLSGQWNIARTGKKIRTAKSGWYRDRNRVVYVHLTEDEWEESGDLARSEGLSREQWLVHRALPTNKYGAREKTDD